MKNFLTKRPWTLYHEESFSAKSPILFLNIAQLLSAFSDNYLRYLTVFFLIRTLGESQASHVAAMAGMIYVTPFLLFSSYGGRFADRFSKQKWIVFLKAFEVVVALFAWMAFYSQNIFACYASLFLMATQSSFFSPAKTSIVVELVGKSGLAKANGILVASSYLAIIIGSASVAFLTDAIGNFSLIAFVLVLITLVGFVASLFIKPTLPQKPSSQPAKFFLAEVLQTIRSCRKTPNLLLAVFGSCSFILLASFFQLNLIPYAIQVLHVDGCIGGYLLFAVSIGIVVGSYIAGRLSKREIDLGLSAFSSLVLSSLLFFLPFFSKAPMQAALLFVVMGFFAGMYSLPFEAYTQAASSSDRIGKVVGMSNFLQFSCVAASSFLIFLLNEWMGLNPLQSFLVVGLGAFALSIAFMQRLSSYLFSLIAKAIFMPLHKVSYTGMPEEGISVMMSRKLPWPMVFMVCASSPHIQLVLCKSKLRILDRVLALLSHVVLITGAHEMRKLKRLVKGDQAQILCLFDDPRMYDYFKKRVASGADLGLAKKPILYELKIEREKAPFLPHLLKKRMVSIVCRSA